MRRLAAALWLVSGVGCASAREAGPSPLEPGASAPALRTDATYASLVREADSAAPGVARGCLLEAVRDGFRFVGEPAGAVTPMPEPDDAGFASVLAARSVRVLSRWGIDGDEGPFVATFTQHRPMGGDGALVVLVSDRGASLRSSVDPNVRADGLSAPALLDALRQRTRSLVVVIATAGLRLDALRPFLEAADVAGVEVALGVAIRPDVEIPAERAEEPSTDAGRCDALPRLAEGEPIGSLEAASVRAAVQPLREALSSCASSSASPRVAVGGRLRVALRVDARGTTSDACMLLDSVGDDAFRRCVLDATRAARWPVPSPAGYVDVVVPLAVAPDARGAQHGLCSATR